VQAPASRVLTRALIAWGLGHLTLGDRRGWSLLALQAVWLVALVTAALAWLGSDRWLLVFGLACGYLAVWALQAAHAYRRAVEAGASSEGAARILLIAPVAVVVITLVFLVGGRVATPGAAFERYVHAWMAGDATTAASLFAQPPSDEELVDAWRIDRERLALRLADTVGSAPGGVALAGPQLSFGSIRFEYPPVASDDPLRAQVDLLIVEEVRVRSTVLGIFPATVQETRIVARAGRATLRREAVGPELPLLPAAGIWRIERIEID